ncbi:uncharacterized protein Fot_42221 [Forsythia ovata]|uniref:DUF7792 domain-containing protein n=1 Tax=Forsythia ovata TaxID=205694 RepID=A0ABD1RKJ4_9LAMI
MMDGTGQPRGRASRKVGGSNCHIAKTEKELRNQPKLMDIVIEVRDARIPMSTSHPQAPKAVRSLNQTKMATEQYLSEAAVRTDLVKQNLAKAIQLADQVIKVADEAALFKKECAKLKSKTDKLAGLLHQAAHASNDLYDVPHAVFLTILNRF